VTTVTLTASEAMKLPDGWRWARLADAISDAQGGFASGERDGSGAIQLRMNNVTTRGSLDWSSTIRVPGGAADLLRYALRAGDVLFNNTNSVELVGKTALFQGHTETVLYSNHFTRLRTSPETLDPAFLAFWLQGQWRKRVFAEICNRWVGQAAVQRDKLLQLQLPLPPLPEQRHIATMLTEQLAAVERARVAAEAQLEAAKALAAAYLRAVFESDKARTWPRAQLADLLTSPLRMGISKRASPTSDKYCLTLSAVRNGRLEFSASKPVEVSDDEARGNWLMPNTLYVVRGNGNRALVGRGGFSPPALTRPMLYPDLLIEIRTNQELIRPEYLRWVWDSGDVRNQIEGSATTAAGIYKINQAKLRAISLPVPPVEQQRRAAWSLQERMSAVEQVQLQLRQQLEAIDELPTALLSQAFRGAPSA